VNPLGHMSRRAFVRDSAAAVVLLTAVPLSWAQSAYAASGKALVRSTFTPLLGATFRMTGGGDDFDVVLAEINDVVPVLRPNDQNRFAAVFSAPAGRQRTQGIRSLYHPNIGHIALFVASVDRGVEASRYEAVVNHV
jgi:hypothetical protein